MGGLGAFKTAMEFRTISEHIRQQILELQNFDLLDFLDTEYKFKLNDRFLVDSGYIDFVDGCWRQNVLVTILMCR